MHIIHKNQKAPQQQMDTKEQGVFLETAMPWYGFHLHVNKIKVKLLLKNN